MKLTDLNDAARQAIELGRRTIQATWNAEYMSWQLAMSKAGRNHMTESFDQIQWRTDRKMEQAPIAENVPTLLVWQDEMRQQFEDFV